MSQSDSDTSVEQTLKAENDTESGAQVRTIKRYANRKLYDTFSSSYVTLQQIAEYVENGESIKIIDNRSKEDVTRITLAQVIYNKEKHGKAFEDSETALGSLRDLIQQRGEKVIASLLDGKVAKLIQRSEGTGSPRWALDLSKHTLEELQKGFEQRTRSLLFGSSGTLQKLQTQLDELRMRIERLERKDKDSVED